MNPYWSYLLTAVGVFGLWLAGRHDRRGWIVGIGAQSLWIAYATATHQWGFYVSALAYGWVYIKNALAWKPKVKKDLSIGKIDILSVMRDEMRKEDNRMMYEKEMNLANSILKRNRYSTVPPYQWYGPDPEPFPKNLKIIGYKINGQIYRPEDVTIIRDSKEE